MIRSEEYILRTEGLTKRFKSVAGGLFRRKADMTAVDNVSFGMYRGEMLGLLGESGCGKSTLAGMLMHLIKPDSGRIWLKGEEVQQLSESDFRSRRRMIQMVYQNPFDCLDPSMRVKRLLEEPLKIWSPHMKAEERLEKIKMILSECGMPEESLSKHPGEFSGGQLQRLAIARALLAEPEVLIADEIISALDISIQNQVLNLLINMKKKHDLSILFITHDLSVARKVSDRVMVMQAGQIKGIGTPDEVFSDEADIYIRKLRSAVFTFNK